jgi:hypothetical protein
MKVIDYIKIKNNEIYYKTSFIMTFDRNFTEKLNSYFLPYSIKEQIYKKIKEHYKIQRIQKLKEIYGNNL